MDWKKLLAFISGSVDDELLLRNEYLVTENRVLRAQIKGRLRLTDGERKALAGIGKKLGKKMLDGVATIVKPETILAWHRRLVAKKFDGSAKRKYPGRPTVDEEVEKLAIRFAKNNRSWGYDRIAGTLKELGHEICDQTVGNILERHGIPPAPQRRKSTMWKEFIRSYMDVLAATDFFKVEVWTKSGLVTYYVLFFMQVATRKIHIAGLTPHPNEQWMIQMARNITMVDLGFLSDGHYLIHDRDGKYCPAFDKTIKAAGVKPIKLPARSPNLNPHAECRVRSVKEEFLSKLILFGERSLRRSLAQYQKHHHRERPHQGKGNVILFPPSEQERMLNGAIRCRERLRGLLKYYYRDAG